MSDGRAHARRLLALARPYRRWILLASVVACLTVLASVGLMTVAGWFIASMAIAGVTTGMMNYFLPAAAIRLLAILRTGGRYAERLVSHETTFRLLAELRLWLFRRLVPLAPADLSDRRGADLASGLQADVETLQHAYLRLGAPVIVAVACGAMVVALLTALHPPTGLAVAALLLCAGGVIPGIARRAAAKPGADAVTRRTALRVAVADFVQGSADLAVAGSVERRLAALAEIGEATTDAQRQTAIRGTEAEAALGLCAWLAVWCAVLLSANAVAAPVVPALALAALAAFEVVAPLPGAMQRWGEVMAAARRLFVLADRSPSIRSAVEVSPSPRDGSLSFQSVRLRYTADSAPALDGFDLRVRDGERVAILGASGAGKSSIARLLLRLAEYEGNVTLGGHDLRSYRLEDARRVVGLAAQETQLFNATLRENLLIAAQEADEAALHRCLEVAGLKAFIAGLPDGLDTWIGEGGARLSAGQARRLVIARALLRDPPILILDEPTENLDAVTSRHLLDELGRERAGRTTLVITHDPATARRFADRIVYMEAGRIVTDRHAGALPSGGDRGSNAGGGAGP